MMHVRSRDGLTGRLRGRVHALPEKAPSANGPFVCGFAVDADRGQEGGAVGDPVNCDHCLRRLERAAREPATAWLVRLDSGDAFLEVDTSTDTISTPITNTLYACLEAAGVRRRTA